MVYGREKAELVLEITDVNDAVVDGTVKWTIEDTLLDGTDNTDTYTDQLVEYKPTKVYESSGVKNASIELEINDGWDNIYTHANSITIPVIEYTAPVLDFSWTPLKPTIVDTVVFTQSHKDTRNDVLTYGRIDETRIDYYNNGVDEIGDKNTTYEKVFGVKAKGISIKLETTYWNGWENKSNSITKVMDMSNIPPVANWAREDLGVCVPNFNWTATSTDLDDDDTTLVHTWKLYQDDELIGEHTGNRYTYPFQFEGSYRLVLRSTDAEGTYHEKVDSFGVVFSTCDGTGGTSGECSPVLKLQSNVWQLVAIPVKDAKVYEDVLLKLQNQTGVAIEELVTLCTTYYGDENKYRAFAVGVTNPLSDNNFPLTYNDEGTGEVTAFWIRTKDFTAVGLPDTIVLEW